MAETEKAIRLAKTKVQLINYLLQLMKRRNLIGKIFCQASMLLLVITIAFACTKEPQTESCYDVSRKNTATNSNFVILEISYDMEVTTQYHQSDRGDYSALDLASVAPRVNRNQVNLKLYEDGQVYMVTEKKDVRNPISIPHSSLPSQEPEVTKTILNRNTLTLYTGNGDVYASVPFEMPSQIKMVNEIKRIGEIHSKNAINEIIAGMQGQQLLYKLEEYISDATKSGIVVETKNEHFVAYRVPLSHYDPTNKNETVILVDRKLNRLAGTKLYSNTGELLMTTLYGYGPAEKPYLTAIKQVTTATLPSGKQIAEETYTRFEDMVVNVNVGNQLVDCGGVKDCNLIISPNPTFNIPITVSEKSAMAPANAPWILRLMSSNGAVLISVTAKLPKTLDLTGLEPGTYTLHARKGNYSETRAIVIEE
jgi:hypothetical protein